MLCFDNTDPFLDEKSIWVATLSDNTQVFQDDGRPGLEEPNAWLRLKDYLKNSSLHILGMHLKFRSHLVVLPKSESGYYIGKGSGKWHGSSRTNHYIIYGYILNGNMIRDWYLTPELIRDKESRTVEQISNYINNKLYINNE